MGSAARTAGLRSGFGGGPRSVMVFVAFDAMSKLLFGQLALDKLQRGEENISSEAI